MSQDITGEIKIRRVGTLEIVSSGYADRYVATQAWLEIEKNGITYRIDESDRWEEAILEFRYGVKYEGATKEQLADAIHCRVYNPLDTYAMYEDGNTRGQVNTTADRIDAGIKVATGYPCLNEYGIEQAKQIANTLSRHEWLVVKTGLDRINREHSRLGKPVVEYAIPE